MKNIRVGKQTFVMTEKDEKKMEENFIDIYVVRQRIKKRLGLQRIEAPAGMRRKEWDKLKRMERLNEMEEAESLKERIQRRRMEELRRKKPHLFTVPQKHGRGKWCSHLMENDIFPKKVAR
ncbi:SA1788 family PVL leukocidin-associated protein [Staphylococcus caprae]|uniref:SA1788 family PVL leukocidin-associated protein n=1 Tax=Staphylococcus caprae TaxID=29380 RepID=UPI00254DB815|nr:SA1788 family PVL leukocidin-associated protein [Staphylococcus caprae]MDK6296540.1 SA1788 family PVL leukocidin-associated protein [Staphylococcus caprae]